MIGIFDSGSGGLTVLKAIRDRLPSANILYFGDIANAPYGSKSHEELTALTIHAVSLLHERGARSIVSACNSTSATLAVSLLEALGMEPAHLIEMVGPTVAFLRSTDERLLVCATSATVRASMYQHAFRLVGKEVEALAIPDLAGAIEFGESDERMRDIIREAFGGIDLSRFDALLLACTHYPLVMPLFREVLGERIILLDPSFIVAERVEKEFWPREAGEGMLSLVISKDSPRFRSLVAHLFPQEPYTIEVLQ